MNFKGIDLSHTFTATLKGINLQNYDLSDANLENTDLRYINLNYANNVLS